jgi:hypothetical protein
MSGAVPWSSNLGTQPRCRLRCSRLIAKLKRVDRCTPTYGNVHTCRKGQYVHNDDDPDASVEVTRTLWTPLTLNSCHGAHLDCQTKSVGVRGLRPGAMPTNRKNALNRGASM